MAKATWNGAVIAESDDPEIVEDNVYFPRNAARTECLRPSNTHTVCGWKGDCSYFDIAVGGEVIRDAACVYEEPKAAAANIRGRSAFWVRVER